MLLVIAIIATAPALLSLSRVFSSRAPRQATTGFAEPGVMRRASSSSSARRRRSGRTRAKAKATTATAKKNDAKDIDDLKEQLKTLQNRIDSL